MPDHTKVVNANSKKTANGWLQTERNAYNQFKMLHGEPSIQSTFISTLSAFLMHLKHLDGQSCVDLINLLGIKNTHFVELDNHHLK